MQPPGHQPRDTDAEMASRLRAGDPSAVDELVQVHRNRLSAITRRMGLDGSTDDVVQDTFVLLWQHPDRFDPSRGTLSAYLTASSRSRALDHLRRESARRGREERFARDEPDRYSHVEADGLRRSLQERLHRALADLPVRQREAIALAYFGHLTYDEVASVLEQPVGTVKSRIRSGLRSLYDTIESDWLEATGTEG